MKSFAKLKYVFLIVLAYALAPIISVLLSIRRRQGEHSVSPKIIVFPQMTRIGDLVCATPVFRAIKERYPQAHLTVFVSVIPWEIIKHNHRIDEIILYEKENIYLGLTGAFRLFRKIQRDKYDWAFILTNNFFHTLIAYFGLIPRRVKTVISGRTLFERLTDWFNSVKVFYRHHTYLPRHYLRLLEPLGIMDAEEIQEVFVSEEGEKKAAQFLAANGIKTGKTLIGISIGAGNKIKEWGDEKFTQLAQSLSRDDTIIVFVGSRSDESRIDAIIDRTKSIRIIKAVDFSIEFLPSLLKRLKLFVSVDTGPLYVAHALGLPVVDIIGPVDPREQPPQDEKSVLILPPPHIQPSSFVMKLSGRSQEHERAVRSITVEAVVKGVEKLIL